MPKNRLDKNNFTQIYDDNVIEKSKTGVDATNDFETENNLSLNEFRFVVKNKRDTKIVKVNLDLVVSPSEEEIVNTLVTYLDTFIQIKRSEYHD